MKTSIFIIAFLTIASICVSCSKTGYGELKGEWIEQVFDTTIYENGKKEHCLVYYEFDFNEDYVIKSIVEKIDGENVFEASCEGSWDYIKGPFRNGTPKEGVIEIVYDLNTFTIEYDILNDPSAIKSVRDIMIENNEIIATVKKENPNSHYGYNIIAIYPNCIEFIRNDSDLIYWTRAEAYEKYGVGGGDIDFSPFEDDEDDISDSQAMLTPKKEFLNEAGTEYYECVITDNNYDGEFFLSLNPEIGTGIYQAPSGNIYYLKIEDENDNRTEFICSAKDSDGNSTKIQFHIDLKDIFNIKGTLLGTDGETVISFVGNLIENE